MAAAAEQIHSPPTYRFRPKKRELVKFYLLPLARGQDPYPGVIFEDDAAGSTLPWDLFERHGVAGEDEAYFVVRAGEARNRRPGARQDRGCVGGVGVWKAQSSYDKSLLVRGERIGVHVCNLNLHMGKGKNGGSVGWVMHEYTIAAPPCPSPVKICHIAFSGHGRKRMRVPDGRQSSAQASGSSSSSAAALPCSGDEEPLDLVLTDDDIFLQSPLLESSDLQWFPSAASDSEQYPELEAQVPTAEQQDIEVPQLMVQQSTMPVARQVSAEQLEFWSSIGIDVESINSFEEEQSTGVQSSYVVPSNGGMATGFQSSYVVPSNGTMATGVQSSYVVPGNGAMATGVQSSYVVPGNGAMATGVQSSYVVPGNSAMATGVQSSYVVPGNSAMATGEQSTWVVPNIGAMATGVQNSWVVPNTNATAGDLDDFCRSVLAKVQTNCAAPDSGNMVTRTLGGGCSLICK